MFCGGPGIDVYPYPVPPAGVPACTGTDMYASPAVVWTGMVVYPIKGAGVPVTLPLFIFVGSYTMGDEVIDAGRNMADE